VPENHTPQPIYQTANTIPSPEVRSSEVIAYVIQIINWRRKDPPAMSFREQSGQLAEISNQRASGTDPTNRETRSRVLFVLFAGIAVAGREEVRIDRRIK
jgi:hypothetical protein